MISQKFTDAYVKLIGGMRDLGDWGEETGQLDVEKVRLTVAARKEKAKELVDAGMSRRQAAEVLGVDETTVRRDIGSRQDAAKNSAERRTPPAADARPRIRQQPVEDETNELIEEISSRANIFSDSVDDWIEEHPDAPPEAFGALAMAISNASDVLAELAASLNRRQGK